MASLLKRLLVVSSALLLLAAIAHHHLAHDDDPYRCRRLLDTGRWVDPADSHGDRMPYTHWQPDGCMLHPYSSADIRQCLQGRRLVFAGDSQNRQTAYAVARLLQRDEAVWDRAHLDKHHSFNVTYHGIEIQMHWNPFFEIVEGQEQQGLADKLDDFLDQLELMRLDAARSNSIESQKGPAFLVIGGGAWFSAPEKPHLVATYLDALHNLSSLVPRQHDFINEPLDVIDGIGNTVFFAPPFGPYYNGGNKDVAENRAGGYKNVRKLQGILKDNAADLNFTQIWSVPNLTDNDNKTFVDSKVNGFHVIDSVAEVRANILLNLRCNARLDHMDGYSHSSTCCTDYGTKPIVQQAAVIGGITVLLVCIVRELVDLVTAKKGAVTAQTGVHRWPLFSLDVAPFVMALLMCYYADRTHMMAKGPMVWSYGNFALLCAPCVIIALVTVRRSPSPSPPPAAAPALEVHTVHRDQPFLSRDQTEEWKGWMQFIILVYHYTAAANSTTVYIAVRLLVAAYLFQTGYGHTIFFLTKKDFSIRRVASVLLRMNLLACSLTYFMDTNYMLYYFSPLVTFWFLVVYFTMAAGHKRLNDDTQLVLVKICISSIVVAGVIHLTPLTRGTFSALRVIFHIKWSVSEWDYRVSLDLFIVYIGMLAGVVNLNLKEILRAPLRICLAAAGCVVIVGYLVTCTSKLHSGTAYRSWHPLISYVPILAFIAIRNASGSVRNYHSRAMAWLGRCSLETYTLQFHLFLASDARGVLLVDAFSGGDGSIIFDRIRSLAIIVPVFLWISSETATATGQLVKIILGTSRPNLVTSNEHSVQTHPHNAIELAPKLEEMESDDEPLLNGIEGRPRQHPRAPVGMTKARTASWLHARVAAIRRNATAREFKRVVTEPLFIRLALMLLAMWLLNLLSPNAQPLPVYDGYTPHRVEDKHSGPDTPVSTPSVM